MITNGRIQRGVAKRFELRLDETLGTIEIRHIGRPEIPALVLGRVLQFREVFIACLLLGIILFEEAKVCGKLDESRTRRDGKCRNVERVVGGFLVLLVGKKALRKRRGHTERRRCTFRADELFLHALRDFLGGLETSRLRNGAMGNDGGDPGPFGGKFRQTLLARQTLITQRVARKVSVKIQTVRLCNVAS